MHQITYTVFLFYNGTYKFGSIKWQFVEIKYNKCAMLRSLGGGKIKKKHKKRRRPITKTAISQPNPTTFIKSKITKIIGKFNIFVG